MTDTYVNHMTEWVNMVMFAVFGLTIMGLGLHTSFTALSIAAVSTATPDIALNMDLEPYRFAFGALIFYGGVAVMQLAMDAAMKVSEYE